MNIINLLKKLNIVRFGGVSGKYEGGKDRPIEFMMGDVVNAETDLVNKKDFKKIIKIFLAIPIILFLILFLIGFISGLSGDSESNDDTAVIKEEKDKTTLFLEDVAEKSNIKDYDIVEEQIIWTSTDIGIERHNTKSLISKNQDITNVINFFDQEGWSNNVIGFNYVEKNSMGGRGYLSPMTEGYDYKGGMCIVFEELNKVSCGWGPGAE